MICCVAAGGTGSRLAPLNSYLNKHLAPVAPGKLMIDYPLEFLRKMGFEEAKVITGSNHASQIVDYVADGERYGFTRIEYAFQNKPLGISDCLKRIEPSSERGVFLILGDNFFSDRQLLDFEMCRSGHAQAWEYDIGDPEKAKSFGQALRHIDGNVFQIVEKPSSPVHGRILTGLYYFPSDVFGKVAQLKPSARNELEITHLLQMYLEENRLSVNQVKGEWADLGEWDSLQKFWQRNNNV